MINRVYGRQFYLFWNDKVNYCRGAYFFTDDASSAIIEDLSPAKEPSLTISQMFSVDYLYSQFKPTVYFLALMVVTLVLKIIEYKFSLKEALSGILIMLSAILVGISPLFGEAYIGLIANFYFFYSVLSCIEIDKIGDASVALLLFYMAIY